MKRYVYEVFLLKRAEKDLCPWVGSEKGRMKS